jgi:hypothetical protein
MAKKKNNNQGGGSRSGSVPVKSAHGEVARFDPDGGASTNPAVFDALGIAEELGLFWEEGAGEKFLLGMDRDAETGRFGSFSEWTKGMVEKEIRQRVFDETGRMICMKARDGNKGEEEMTSEMVRVLLAAMKYRKVWVAFDGLAGYLAGEYFIQGRRVLVKRSPKRIDFSEGGDFPTVRRLIEGLLGDEASVYFHSWMKLSLESMLNCEAGEWRNGQALIFAGDADSGKSRLQDQIITPMLGGRMADPGKYLFGKTDFNGELIYAEHLTMADPENSTKSTDRIAFGEKVKGLVANDWHSLHKKKEDALMGSPFWRVSISVNADPDKLRVLPMLTPDMKDKVMVFHVTNSGDAGLPTGSQVSLEGVDLDAMVDDDLAERKAWRDRISEELPCYGYWLMNDFVIPHEMRVGANGRRARFGVNAWLDEDLCASMSDETPSSNLLALIHAAEFTKVGTDDHGFEGETGRKLKLWELPGPVNMGVMGRGKDFEGNGWWWAPIKQGPLKLQRLLCADHRRPEEGWVCSMAPEAEKLMGKYPNACELMLKRLGEDEPEQVGNFRDREAGRGWVVSSPTHVIVRQGQNGVSLAERSEDG